MSTGNLCAHFFCTFEAVHCFVLAAKLQLKNGVWLELTMYTVTYRVLMVWPQHHFVPVPRHWFPGTRVDSPIEAGWFPFYLIRISGGTQPFYVSRIWHIWCSGGRKTIDKRHTLWQSTWRILLWKNWSNSHKDNNYKGKYQQRASKVCPVFTASYEPNLYHTCCNHLW